MQGGSFVADESRRHRLARLASLPLWVWCLVAVAVFALLELRVDPTRLVTSLGDADDATRLIQVRELINGASWFDRTLPSIGAPEPLVSHWSRLIDAPLALMLVTFERVMSPATAELAVRALWPLIVFLPLLFFLARESGRLAGRGAAAAILGLAVYAHSGVMQFSPGRIDHHNMMILGSVAGILLLTESLTVARVGWLAGAMLGLGVAVGYEGLGLTAATLAIAGVASAWSGRGLPGIRRAAAGFAATLTLALIVTATPRQWLDIRCDALGLNLVLLAAAGACGLYVVDRIATYTTALTRVIVLGAFATLGAGLFAFSEPACLAGPFGQVDPTVRSMWLDHVEENHNLWAALQSQPLATAQFLIATLLGLVAAAWRFRRLPSPENGLPLAALVVAVAMSAVHIKLMPYATFLALVPLAVTIAELPAIGGLTALSARLIAFLAVNQHSILAALLLSASLGTSEPAVKAGSWSAMSETLDKCTATRSIAPLAALPPGLVVADVDFGSFIAALTPHRVMTAPYHRIDKTILEALALRSATPAETERRLRALHADYVVTCRSAAPGDAGPETLLAQLHAGTAPAYLEQLPMPDFTPLRVWRLKPAASR